ncbi:hypothetical protein S245_070415 [Arachis hypogaea]|nr:Protein IQ-DOMAIN [Arachis hypogaea]
MGKKGSWFSAIKRVFTHHSKEKQVPNDSENKSSKDKKKKGLGKLRHGETNSFIPLFREPSSIEKIFGDFEREQQLLSVRPPTPLEQPKPAPVVPPRAASPRAPSPRAPSPRAASPKAPSPRATSPKATSSRVVHHHKEVGYRPEPTLRNQHAAASKIQAVYRGYMARRSFRALKGLVRLQGVVRGQNVKRQTVNAMKHMQLLVRVQSQIQSRRIQMLENQARYQAELRNDKDVASTLGKLTSENEEWDDSLLTKEEIEARLQRKVEAIIKRERAMAFAYSHQLWKSTPKSSSTPVTDLRSGPWWWNWLERQMPASSNPQEKQSLKNFQITTPRPYSEQKTSPKPASTSTPRQHHFAFDNMDIPTPKSTKSTILPSSKPSRTPPYRTPQPPIMSKYSRAFDVALKDDDSLTSCPPFSVPNYMAPTVSAKAKVRANSNPRERFGGVGTPTSDSKRRLSFPFTQGIGSFKWNNSNNGKTNKDLHGSNHRMQLDSSIGNMSVDSTVSLPATMGRKPFTRFV